MTVNSTRPTFESSLKALEMENIFDRIVYRPVGFRIALGLRYTAITPNMITITSIFVGMAAGWLFYFENIWINLAGIAVLIVANILDCVDGQLARLTGIKSQVGRILDGIAGDLWFISIYIFLSLRLTPHIGGALAWTLAALAGISNLVQANITDYYKTLHLFFISSKDGIEFDSVENVREHLEQMPKCFNRFLYRLYLYYTILQTTITPRLQKFLALLHTLYPNDIPQELRQKLRSESLKIIPNINILTFNWRSLVLFISLLVGQVWIYLLWEIVVLNIAMIIAVSRHEKMCRNFEV
ncbi:MAG: CDP-alcohol phosphatidyltransferase family protein [Paludibacter sp.]|nr:CDP-alcohol phosphatidyltransferase family protein [Paludibacter sp.]